MTNYQMKRNKWERGQKILIKRGMAERKQREGQEHKLFCVKGPYVGKRML